MCLCVKGKTRKKERQGDKETRSIWTCRRSIPSVPNVDIHRNGNTEQFTAMCWENIGGEWEKGGNFPPFLKKITLTQHERNVKQEMKKYCHGSRFIISFSPSFTNRTTTGFSDPATKPNPISGCLSRRMTRFSVTEVFVEDCSTSLVVVLVFVEDDSSSMVLSCPVSVETDADDDVGDEDDGGPPVFAELTVSCCCCCCPMPKFTRVADVVAIEGLLSLTRHHRYIGKEDELQKGDELGSRDSFFVS